MKCSINELNGLLPEPFKLTEKEIKDLSDPLDQAVLNVSREVHVRLFNCFSTLDSLQSAESLEFAKVNNLDIEIPDDVEKIVKFRLAPFVPLLVAFFDEYQHVRTSGIFDTFLKLNALLPKSEKFALCPSSGFVHAYLYITELGVYHVFYNFVQDTRLSANDLAKWDVLRYFWPESAQDVKSTEMTKVRELISNQPGRFIQGIFGKDLGHRATKRRY